jgi:hypothetical protein
MKKSIVNTYISNKSLIENNNLVVLWAVLYSERALIENQEIFAHIEKEALKTEEIVLNAFEATYDWLNKIKSEIFSTPKIAESLMMYEELCNDPLYFECYFKARNPEFYQGVYEKFLILLRTAPVERLASFLSCTSAQKNKF